MAIDIRATVTCSLGTLISGSISDDYIQGSGLVKTRGSVEISGTITPALGTVVTFSYVKGGVTRGVPRKLRVLSSFADPFRRTTKVELGCKLTYLSDLKDPVDWTAFDDPGNTGFTEDDTRVVTLPIRASSVMAQCLTKLGITASSNPLTNKFSIATFDFSAGYVQVLNDLLVSESYCGYLDTNEVLQVFALDQDAGTGPVFTASDIVDLAPIGVGALPGEAVTVSYSSLKLKQPEPDADAYSEDTQKRLWERSVSTANGLTYYVGTRVYTGSETTTTLTTYRRIAGSDLPVRRVTTETGSSAKIAGSIGTAYVNNGIGFNAINTTLRQEEEIITYDQQGNRLRSQTTIYEQALAIFGSVNLNYVFSQSDFVSFSYVLLPSGRTEQTYDTIGDAQQEVSSTYVMWPFTLTGQQAVAEYSEQLTTSADVSAFVNDIARSGLVHERTTTTINTAGVTNGRPFDVNNASYAKGGDPNNGWRTESKADLQLALGSATAQRRIEFSMPYAPDDIFSGLINPITGLSLGVFTAVASDAPAKANRYGRVQNRLLLGNRSGMNLQLAPERLPAEPFAPLYVEANGLTALYRANGTNWAFDSNGIVCSIDALFWGAVGGTGTFWFPVAPGITALPTTPPVVDTSPTAVIGTVATVGAAPQTTLNTAFPTAISGDGVQDQATSNFWVYDGTSWDDVGPTPGPTTEATSVVLPYNETAIYDARLTLTAAVTKFDYALTLLTEVPPLVTKLQAQVFDITLLAAAAGSFAITGQAAALVRRYRLQAAATSFAVTGFSAGSIRDYAIGTNAGSFTAEGQPAALRVDRNPLAAEAGSFAATGQDATLRVVQPLRGDAGAFALTGEAANFIRSLRLPAEATSFSVTGSAAGLFAEDYFSRWATQTYGYEGLVYPSWWAD